MNRWLNQLSDERGAAIALVALSMVAMLSAIALAVDVGMLVSARAEAQRAADSGALAGAFVLGANPGDSTGARNEAQLYGQQNSVRGLYPVILDEDVIVDLDKSWVTVNVRRTAERESAVPTFFARIFGVNTVNISATATAEAAEAPDDSGAECLLPIMLPDRWSENGLNTGPEYWPTADDSFDYEGSKISGSKDTTVDDYDFEITGYDEAVIGERIEIHKSGGGGGGMNPSWYYKWAPYDDADQLKDGGPGAARYEDRFTRCMEGQYLPGDSIWTEPGGKVGPNDDAFEQLVALDPEMEWRNDCPWRPSTSSCDYGSPRIRPMPMFDPRGAPDNGRKLVYIAQFAQIFVEGEGTGSGANQGYYARWMGYITPDPGGSENDEEPVEDEEGPIVKKIRLIR